MAQLAFRAYANTGVWVPINADGDNQRAWRMLSFVMPTSGWITRLGVWARKRQGADGNNPQIWLGIYAVDGSGQPTDLLAATARLPIPNTAQDVSGALTWVNPATGGSRSALLLTAGTPYALAVKAEKVDVELAGYSDRVWHYRRSVGALNSPPTTPFNAGGTSLTQIPAMYADYVENTAPVAAPTTPTNGQAVNSQTPTFVVGFSDGQTNAPMADRLRGYALEVSRVSDGEVLWGGAAAVFPASAAERAAWTVNRPYAGPALAADGTVYRWRAQVQDDAGAWSLWSAPRTFTINPVGQVDTATDGVPTGKLDLAASAVTYSARWHHPLGLAANAVQAQVLRNGQVFRVGQLFGMTALASSALPGTARTFAAVSLGLSTLPPGAYSYQIRMRASDGQVSPWSDPARPFVINSPPTMAANLQPPTGAASSSLPLLEWNIDDPDDDDVYGVDAVSDIEITRPNSTVVTITTPNYDPATGKGSFQLTATELTGFGVYGWRVRGRDLSAGASGVGPWSPLQTLNYFSGPIVTVVNPTYGEVFPTSVPVISATIPSGLIARFEVRLYGQDARLPLRTSGEVAQAPASSFTYQIPVGWLRNGGDYDLEVAVWNGSNQLGRSLRIPFTVAYGAALAPTGYAASPVQERHDYVQSPSAVLLAWDPTQYSPGEFAGYNVYRRQANQAPDQRTLLRTITAPGQTRWRDQWARSNTLMVYGLSQLRRVGADLIESDVIEAQAELELLVPILNSAYDPDIRFPMMYMSDGYAGYTDRPEAAVVTWGSNNKETAITAPVQANTRIIDFSVTVRSDERGALEAHLADIEAVIASGHPLLFRPERPEETMYCQLKNPKWKRGALGTRVLTGQLREIAFKPGFLGGS